MKILFFGDSITDACRDRNDDYWFENAKLGLGYVMQIAGALRGKDPARYEILNRGISGDRVVDLYARIKRDVINHKPDVVSILVGINDIWHEVSCQNGVALPKYDKIYRMMVEEIQEALPSVRIVLCEPFVLRGCETTEHFEAFDKVRDYARVVKKIAVDRGCFFLPLQKKFDEAAKKAGTKPLLLDGVHPGVAGAALIANAWLDLFSEKVDK